MGSKLDLRENRNNLLALIDNSLTEDNDMSWEDVLVEETSENKVRRVKDQDDPVSFRHPDLAEESDIIYRVEDTDYSRSFEDLYFLVNPDQNRATYQLLKNTV